MSVYRIAEINIKINPKSDYVKKQFSDFEIESDFYDFEVTVTDDDQKKELEIYRKNSQTQDVISMELCESLALYRKICKKILSDYNGIIFHSASIEYKSKAYLFTAPSGTGKTTHIKLWKQYLGDSVRIINGDKPVLRLKDNKIYVYGTPYNGKENYGSNISAVLDGIFILKRNKINSVKRCDVKTAIPFIFSQTLRYKDEKSIKCLSDFVGKMLTDIPVYILECNTDISAVETSLSAIEKKI